MVQTFWNKIKKGFLGDSPAYQGFGLSDRGRKRRHNEDAFFVSDVLGLYVVADGMGGHAHGEVASRLAVESVSEQFILSKTEGSPSFLTETIKEANRKIYEQSEEMISLEAGASSASRMGTTIVALTMTESQAFIAHVGDSRLYRMREGELERLTRDHSLAEIGNEFGDPLDTRPPVMIQSRFKHIITRALGLEADVKVEVREEILQKGDLFLLCSDGLSNMVSDRKIEEILSSSKIEQSTCNVLVNAANENGGQDNISCVLVQYG